MNYFFQVCFRNNQGIIFSNKEYLCEETTKANLGFKQNNILCLFY